MRDLERQQEHAVEQQHQPRRVAEELRHEPRRRRAPGGAATSARGRAARPATVPIAIASKLIAILNTKPAQQQRRPFQDRRDDGGRIAGRPAPARSPMPTDDGADNRAIAACQRADPQRHPGRRRDGTAGARQVGAGLARHSSARIPGMRIARSQRSITQTSTPTRTHVVDEQHVHHLRHVQLVRPDLARPHRASRARRSRRRASSS